MLNTLIRGRVGALLKLKGYVRWQLQDIYTGKITKSGKHNAIVNVAREELAKAFIGTSITFPGFIGIGTGTNGISASDTALQTISQYDASNDAKVVDSKTIRGTYTSRYVIQFLTGEANVNIRELGLFDAANSGKMWARVNVIIDKTSSQRLTVYWYISLLRSQDLAIKTGQSLAGTGTRATSTKFTVTFSSPVTIVFINNNSGAKCFIKLNGGMDAGSPPTTYDYMLPDQTSLGLTDEEIDISSMDVFGSGFGAGALPDNEFSAVGW